MIKREHISTSALEQFLGCTLTSQWITTVNNKSQRAHIDAERAKIRQNIQLGTPSWRSLGCKRTSPIDWFDDYSASWVHRGNDHTPTWLIPVWIIKFLLYCLYILIYNVNSSHTFIVFLILISWETDLQKSIDFLLNPFFVFRNDLYVNLLHYMYTCCYTKMK